MMDLSLSRDCTSKKRPRKSLEKSICPTGSRKWLGILADDVSQHLGQSSSSFQLADVWIIFTMAQPMRKAPQGVPPLIGY